jgi:hypothetical protein
MRELSASTFPLGETSLHLLHTPDGNMFVTADLAVKLFDSAPATFAEFVRANRYVRVNSMERAVVRLCASLGIPPETAGGDKPVSVPAGVATNDDARDAGRDGKTSSNASDAVTLLPERSVLAILVDRRDARRAAQFRESAARRSFVAAERLVNLGDFENALPLALDAVRRAQEIHETPRARRAAEAASVVEKNASSSTATKTSSPSETYSPSTSAPNGALFEPYLLAATIALALGKTDACENLVGLASWIALRRGDEDVSQARRARLRRVRGELRLRQGRKRDALEEFASAAVHAAEASGPQTPRVALELFKLADAFREDTEIKMVATERVPSTPPSPDEDAASPDDFSREAENSETTSSAREKQSSFGLSPSPPDEYRTNTKTSISADDHAACLRSASRCDAAATNIWLAAAADAIGGIEAWSAKGTDAAASAFATRAKLSSFSPQSRVSFADLPLDALEEACEALGRVAAREGSATKENETAATASLARGLILFAARDRSRLSVSDSTARREGWLAEDGSDAESASGDEESFSTEKKARAFAPTFEEAVACVAEAMTAFPPASDGAAFARATLERWSGGGDEA